MAVSKRTRFEVLRRDNYTCQYCGGKAPDVTLHVDHVEPISLGGSDKPDNLVAACKDCNIGKASVVPDSPLVNGLGERAAVYALGMQDKMTRFRSSVESFDDYLDAFRVAWDAWHTVPDDVPIRLPADFELSLFRWHTMGVPIRVIEMAVPKAMSKNGLRGEDAEFSYMCGIVWKMIDDLQIDYSVTEDTAAVYTENEASERAIDGYEHGRESGRNQGHREIEQWIEDTDFLMHHIDGTSSALIDRFLRVA